MAERPQPLSRLSVPDQRRDALRLGEVKRSIGYVYIKATLTGYAYETIPNKSIIMGNTRGADEWDEDEFMQNEFFTQPIHERPEVARAVTLALGNQNAVRRRKEESEVN